MKAKLIIIYTLAFHLIVIYPQDTIAMDLKQVDSLKRLLDTNLTYRTHFEVLLSLSQHYEKTDSVWTVKYSNAAFELAENNSREVDMIRALTPIISLNINLNNYERAKEIANTVILKSKSIKYLKGQVLGLYHLGKIEGRRGNHFQAFETFTNALSLHEGDEDDLTRARILRDIGIMQVKLGDESNAVENFLSALKIYQEYSEVVGIASTSNALGIVFKKRKEFEKAREYYTIAMQSFKEIDNKNGEFAVLINLANIHFDLKEYEKAINLYKESIELSRAVNSFSKIAVAKQNIASATGELGDLDGALELFKEVLNLYVDLEDQEGISYAYNNIGKCYRDLGEYEKAKIWLNKGKELASKIGYLSNIAKATKALAEVEEELGNYQNAYHFLSEYDSLYDTLRNKNTFKKIIQLETKYEYEKREHQLLSKQEQAKLVYEKTLQEKKFSQRLTLLLLASIALIAIITGRSYILIRKKKLSLEIANKQINSRNIEVESQKDTLETALKNKELLMSEIHHRTKNNLLLVQNLLSAQLMDTENKKVRTALSSVRNRLESIRLIHDILYQSDSSDFVSLKDYLGSLSGKLLEGFSNSDRIDINLDIEDVSVNKDIVVTIGLIANEVLTNSFKHAFTKSMLGLVTIEVRIENEFLKMNVSDNGVGIPSKRLRKESLGMRLIDGLSGQLRASYKIINDFGTRFYIHIPLEIIKVKINTKEKELEIHL